MVTVTDDSLGDYPTIFSSITMVSPDTRFRLVFREAIPDTSFHNGQGQCQSRRKTLFIWESRLIIGVENMKE